MKTLGRRVLRSLCAAVLVAAIWLLSESRPPLSATVRFTTASGADRVLGFLAWLGCLLIAVGLLYRVARRNQQRGAESPAPIRHLHPLQRDVRARRRTVGGYPTRAFPLIPRPRSPLMRETPPAIGPTQPEPDHRFESDPGLPSDGPTPAAGISLLGPLTITGGQKHGRRLRGATHEFLAYLALHSAGAQRDQIIDALWSDQTPEQGRNRLWRAATDARAHLGDGILTRDGDQYALNRKRITVDVDRLEQLLAEISRVDGNGESALLEQALALFAGEPLGGSDFVWAENEQRRLQAVHLDLLERAGRARLANNNPSSALACAEDGLSYEPYNEKLARLAMEAEAALGHRSAVIRRYDALRELLEDQLGLQPHHETRRLYRDLLSQGGVQDNEPLLTRAVGDRQRSESPRSCL